MDERHPLSRRSFVGSVAAALGYLGLGPDANLFAQSRSATGQAAPRARATVEEYDSLAKLANNENPWGPPESVMKAMTDSFKFANRYGYPDGGLTETIASKHGVGGQNVLLGAGSTELLEIVAEAFVGENKKVIGVEDRKSVV